MREVKFDIDAPEFEMAKEALNGMMQGVLAAIMRGQTEDGTVVLKVDIESKRTMEGISPTTKYKCTASYKKKDDVDGNIHFGGRMMLEQGEDGEIYGISDEPEQVTMEDVLDEET